MKKSIMILLIVLSASFVVADEAEIVPETETSPFVIEIEKEPETVKVTGRIQEKGTKAPLKNQRFYIRKEGEKKVTLSPLTDKRGRFSFDIEPGRYQFVIASAGYDKYERVHYINLNKTQRLVIRVIPLVINPYKIVVRKKKEKSEISEKTITIQEAASVPGNNRDVLQAVNNMPGVSSVSVFNGYGNGVVIRGSSQEDSLFPLEGHRLSSLYHFGGLESILEPEFIESIDYNAGGFSAEYGNTLGGVVSMNVRNPRQDRFGGYVNVSLLSSSFMCEGPISENDSFAFSIKRGFLDHYMKMAEKIEGDDEEQSDGSFEEYPVYYDGSFIYRHEFSNNNDLRIIGIVSDDTFEFNREETYVFERFSDKIKYSEKGQTLIGEWNYATDKLTYQLSPKISQSRFLWEEGKKAYHKHTIVDVAINEKLEYKVSKHHLLKSGLNLDFANVDMDSYSFNLEKEGEIDNDFYKKEMRLKKDFNFFYPSFYIMDQMRFGKVTITPGINSFHDSHNHKTVVDPRLFLKYQLTKKAALKTSTGLYSKMPLHDESIEPWGTKGLKPERSRHAVIGAEYYFTDDLHIDIQGYYKQFYDMAVRVDDGDPSKFANVGKGKSYGSEILLRHEMTDNFFGWLSYSWAVAKRKDGSDEPERYFDSDITHNLIGVLSYKPNRYWSFGFKYQYVSGRPYTELLNVSTMYDVDNDVYTPLYDGEINNSRFDSHHQLDFRIDKYWLFDNFVMSTYIDIKNMFQAKHEVGIEYNEDYTADAKILAIGSETPLIFAGVKIDF